MNSYSISTDYIHMSNDVILDVINIKQGRPVVEDSRLLLPLVILAQKRNGGLSWDLISIYAKRYEEMAPGIIHVHGYFLSVKHHTTPSMLDAKVKHLHYIIGNSSGHDLVTFVNDIKLRKQILTYNVHEHKRRE